MDDALRLDPDHLGMPEDAVTYLRGLLWFDRAGELRPGKQAEFDAAALVAAYARAADLFHRVGVPGQAVGALENLTAHFPQARPSAVPRGTGRTRRDDPRAGGPRRSRD